MFFNELLDAIALFAEHKRVLQLLRVEQWSELGQQLHDLVGSDCKI